MLVERWILRLFTPGLEEKFPLVIVLKKRTDMCTADACVVRERLRQEVNPRYQDDTRVWAK